MVRIFCMKREADAFNDVRSKKIMTVAAMQQADMATPAITPTFSASVGSGLGILASSATTDKSKRVHLPRAGFSWWEA